MISTRAAAITARGSWVLGGMVVFALLQLLDIVTTAAGLAAGHKELNPLSALILRAGGMPGLVIFKAVVVTVVGENVRHLGSRWAHVALGLACCFVLLTVLSNLNVLAH